MKRRREKRAPKEGQPQRHQNITANVTPATANWLSNSFEVMQTKQYRLVNSYLIYSYNKKREVLNRIFLSAPECSDCGCWNLACGCGHNLGWRRSCAGFCTATLRPSWSKLLRVSCQLASAVGPVDYVVSSLMRWTTRWINGPSLVRSLSLVLRKRRLLSVNFFT